MIVERNRSGACRLARESERQRVLATTNLRRKSLLTADLCGNVPQFKSVLARRLKTPNLGSVLALSLL